VAFPPSLSAESSSAEAARRVRPAIAVREGVALGAPEERVARDDALAKVTNTGGISNVLALDMLLAVAAELAAPQGGALRKAEGYQG